MDVVDFGFGQGEEQITPRGGEGDGDCVRGFQKIVWLGSWSRFGWQRCNGKVFWFLVSLTSIVYIFSYNGSQWDQKLSCYWYSS